VVALCLLLCHGVAVVLRRGVVESCSLLAKQVGMKGEGTHLGVIMKKTTTNDNNVIVCRLVTTSLPVTWHLGAHLCCGRMVVVHRGCMSHSWW
jgi:hypothetical protein